MEEGRGVLLVVQRHLMVGWLGARQPGQVDITGTKSSLEKEVVQRIRSERSG